MKILKPLLFILLAVVSTTVPFNTAYAVKAETSHRAVIVFSTSQNKNQVSITARMTENDGIACLNLTLDYDSSAMKLVNANRGTALSTLSYLTTNTEGAEGFAYRPFKFTWMPELAKDNDYSIGTLVTMTFEIFNEASDGKYTVTFDYDKYSDIAYYEGTDLSSEDSTLIIDKAVISINKGKIKVENQNSKTNYTWLIITIIAASLALIAVAIILISKNYKNRKWKKLDE